MTNYVVYMHTSPTGKSYIGITNDYYTRCSKHRTPTSGCTAFYNAIKKYGWETFDHRLIKEDLSLDQANYWEGFYIEKENTLSPHGYNLKTGGNVVRLSDETKAKLSAINTGKKHTEATKLKVSMATRNMSDETKAKMSASGKLKIFTPEHKANITASQIGKIISAETRAKLSAFNTGKRHTEETKLKITISNKSNPNYKESIAKATASRTKYIIRSDGKEFKGMKSAALETGCSIPGIAHALNGRTHTIKGFSFTYKESRSSASNSNTKIITCSDGREFKGVRDAALGTGYSFSAISKSVQGIQATKRVSFSYKVESK